MTPLYVERRLVNDARTRFESSRKPLWRDRIREDDP
jgi:hypothetical protein